jgi:hypothetical protein
MLEVLNEGWKQTALGEADAFCASQSQVGACTMQAQTAVKVASKAHTCTLPLPIEALPTSACLVGLRPS